MFVTPLKRALHGVLYLIMGPVAASEIAGARFLVNCESQDFDPAFEQAYLARVIARRRLSRPVAAKKAKSPQAISNESVLNAPVFPTREKIECYSDSL